MNEAKLAMKTFFLITITTALLIAAMAACAEVPAGSIPPQHGLQPAKTMRPFQSEQELSTYLRALAEKQKSALRAEQYAQPSAPSAVAGVASKSSDAKSETKDDESVTNVQHAGVDEGGIVKVHGDHLVVLRRPSDYLGR